MFYYYIEKLDQFTVPAKDCKASWLTMEAKLSEREQIIIVCILVTNPVYYMC